MDPSATIAWYEEVNAFVKHQRVPPSHVGTRYFTLLGKRIRRRPVMGWDYPAALHELSCGVIVDTKGNLYTLNSDNSRLCQRIPRTAGVFHG